jgi:very-short-patch-repair endonuclease
MAAKNTQPKNTQPKNTQPKNTAPRRRSGGTGGHAGERLPADVLRLALDQSISDAGLPAPTKEYQFARAAIKRQWRIDLSWPDVKIALEIEGGVHMRGRHLRPEGFVRDMEKYNRLALWGWLLIRVTYDMIADGAALALLEEAFAYRAAQAA